MDKDLGKFFEDVIGNSINEIMESTYMYDVYEIVKKKYNFDLAPNQVEIVEAVMDHEIKNLLVLAARSSGKTFSVIIGALLLALQMENFSIGISAPTYDQSQRLLQTFQSQFCDKNNYLKNQIKSISNSRVLFKNGNFIESFSGDIMSLAEGRHYDMLVIDEAQSVDDYVMSRMLLPMIASSSFGKIIKIGTPRGKNHFFKSAHSVNYKTLVFDWLNAPNLLKGGVINYEGKQYSKYVYGKMPLAKCKEYFPKEPKLWHDGDMTVEDFVTEFECGWQAGISQFLYESEIDLLFGDFLPEKTSFKDYYFGLDLAGGSDVAVDTKHDYTVLTIVRIEEGVKQIVDSFSWQGDFVEQIDEIIKIIHPNTGIYKCIGGVIDRGQVGSAVYDVLKSLGVECDTVMYQSTYTPTGKNMKNSMFDHFKMELNGNRVKYPAPQYSNNHKVLKMHIAEWLSLEKIIGSGINNKIQAPSGLHDDTCCSTAMAIFAADKKLSQSKEGKARRKQISFKSPVLRKFYTKSLY